MIEKREKRKRIFYVPGMISLVFIPLFCFCHFYKTNAFKVYGGLELGLPYEDLFHEYKFPTLRKYKIFDFNGEMSEKNKLEEMTFYLRDLKVKKDTINGIQIHFGPKANYQTFISSIEILTLEDAPTWIINDNDIFVIGCSNTPKKRKKSAVTYIMNCGTGELMRQHAYWEQKAIKEEEDRNFKISFFKEKWKLLFLGYAGLVFLNMFTLVKFNKNQNYNQK
jgi:hypothetical protein